MRSPKTSNTTSVPSPTHAGVVANEFFSSDELAEDLGITLRTLLRWRDKRIGPPPTPIGRRVYYRCEAVREWLLRREGTIKIGRAPRRPKPDYSTAPRLSRTRNARREARGRHTAA